MGDEGFDGFFDMDELEEESPFDGMDDDGFLDFDDQGGDDEGISRTFVIAAALITIAVVVVIVLLLMVALSGDAGPSSREQTATGVVLGFWGELQAAGTGHQKRTWKRLRKSKVYGASSGHFFSVPGSTF